MRSQHRNLIGVGLLVAVTLLIPTCTFTFGPSIVLWDWPSTNEFRRTVAGADRVVVTATDCFGPTQPAVPQRLFVETDPAAVRELIDGIDVLSPLWGSNVGMIGAYSNPQVEFYSGDERIAAVGLVAGRSIRWGERWRNADGDLTVKSQAWLRQWLRSHGVEPTAAPLHWSN